MRQSLRVGKLTVYIQPLPDKVAVGEKFTFNVGLQDETMPLPVTAKLTVRVIEAAKDEISSPLPKPAPPKPKPETKGKQPEVGLPQYVLLTKDGRAIPGHPAKHWPADLTDNDGGLISDMGEGIKVHKINYDNAFHLASASGSAISKPSSSGSSFRKLR